MPIEISAARLDEIRAQLPEGPRARRRRFTDEFGLCDYDAGVLCQDKALADYYEETVAAGADAKRAANWVMTEVLRELSHRAIAITDFALRPDRLAGLIAQIDNGVINDKIAKTVFAEMVTSPKTAADIVKEKGLEQVTDDSAIDEFVQQAIAENPDAVAEFREGKEKALNYLVGQVMRFSRGKANPKMAADALRQALS
jgi:aspartyl-tRNA(Asn)/glutamyl-tRNA(Gln) amidotransferase subunit B